MNMSNFSPTEQLALLLRALANPVRLQVLLTIGTGEACVCHLEAKLGLRQAHISQQLMALREAGLLDSRKEGRFVYYSLIDPMLLTALYELAVVAGIPAVAMETEPEATRCSCPKCEDQNVLISINEID